MNFWGKKDKGHHHGGPPVKEEPMSVEELQSMLDSDGSPYEDKHDDDVEMTPRKDEEVAVA